MAEQSRLDKVISLARHRGFVFQAGEIYGGSRSAWDYGPLGTALKENIKRQWWKSMVQKRDDVVGIDSSVILPKRVWEASGHVDVFSDPLVECTQCHKRYREDHLIEAFEEKKGREPKGGLDEIVCANCGTRGQWTEPRAFSGLLKTYLGPVDDEAGMHYLRPETAQGIFVNFANVLQAARMKPPFGIGQIGKSFRNEITPGNFIFRTREFEQMELEFFTRPGEDLKWYEYYKAYCLQFLEDLGISKEHLRLREHSKEELAHYSNGTSDIEYNFGAPIGWGELWGIADRTDYDLKAHMNTSKQSLEYFDQESGEKFVPYCIEPSVGVERMMLALMYEAYEEQQLEKDTRIVLHLHPYLAPIKACVLPLSKKLSEEAMEVYRRLSKFANCEYDEAGSIGKRYRRQDAIGTPFCVTVDFETQQDRCVTIRHRDSMEQVRIPLDQLEEYITSRIGF